MKQRLGSFAWKVFLPALLAGVFLWSNQRASAFNIEDYFILRPGCYWHYTGEGQPGSSADDDFSWSVRQTVKDLQNGRYARRIQTKTDEPDDSRNNDEDFWILESNGDLFFWGFHNGTDDTGFPKQDIFLTDPLRIGGRGLNVGDTVTDTGAGEALVEVPVSGLQTVDATLNVTVDYLEIIDQVDTPIGPFEDVLHLRLGITGIAFADSVIGPVQIPFNVRAGEIYLAPGIGMIKQDQNADPNDAEVQVIDDIAGFDQTGATDWQAYE